MNYSTVLLPRGSIRRKSKFEIMKFLFLLRDYFSISSIEKYHFIQIVGQ